MKKNTLYIDCPKAGCNYCAGGRTAPEARSRLISHMVRRLDHPATSHWAELASITKEHRS